MSTAEFAAVRAALDASAELGAIVKQAPGAGSDAAAVADWWAKYELAREKDAAASSAVAALRGVK